MGKGLVVLSRPQSPMARRMYNAKLFLNLDQTGSLQVGGQILQEEEEEKEAEEKEVGKSEAACWRRDFTLVYRTEQTRV